MIPVVGMVCLAAMAITGMFQGIDGVLYLTCASLIAGVAGYKVKGSAIVGVLKHLGRGRTDARPPR